MTLKILIADDDARIRGIIRQVVADLAGMVWEATDGAEAIDICLAERPDWVLLDLRMSPVDGLVALREIKAQIPETRVVIISQYDEPGLRAKAMKAGACAYLPKDNLLALSTILTSFAMEPLSAPPRLPPHSNSPNWQ